MTRGYALVSVWVGSPTVSDNDGEEDEDNGGDVGEFSAITSADANGDGIECPARQSLSLPHIY